MLLAEGLCPAISGKLSEQEEVSAQEHFLGGGGGVWLITKEINRSFLEEVMDVESYELTAGEESTALVQVLASCRA